MPNLELITKIILMFSNEVVLAPLLIGGFLAAHRKIFAHAIFLLMFTMIFNVFLKHTFKIPLSEHLHIKGYAFPSGHMATSVAVYGWFIIKSKNHLINFGLCLLIIAIGYSLVYRQYHNFADVISSAVIYSLLVLLYNYITIIKLFDKHPYYLGYFVLLSSAVIIYFFPNKGNMPNILYMAFFVLLGFSLSWHYFFNSINENYSIVSALIGFFCMFGVYCISIKIKNTLSINYDFHWLIIGLLVPLVASFTNNKSTKKIHSKH